MSMFEMIRSQLAGAVPFAGLAGVEVVEIGLGRAVARLVQRPELGNHIGTLHAGALFTLGEAASGGAMIGAFADRIMQVRPVAADARITFGRPATGTVTATATCSEAADALKATLDAQGKVCFAVTVDITDEQSASVAGMVVVWHVRKT